MYTRRRLLGSAATIAAASVAGCSGALGEESGESTGDPDGIRLEELSIQNAHGVEHRIQIAVEADGEMLHLGTYDLDDETDRSIEGVWRETPDSYRIHVTLDDGPVRSADIGDSVGAGADCARVLVRVGTDGELAIWTGGNCDSDADEEDFESV